MTKLTEHVLAYALVNALLVATWASIGGRLFWPAFVMAAWGVCLAVHAWATRVAASGAGHDRNPVRRPIEHLQPRV